MRPHRREAVTPCRPAAALRGDQGRGSCPARQGAPRRGYGQRLRESEKFLYFNSLKVQAVVPRLARTEIALAPTTSAVPAVMNQSTRSSQIIQPIAAPKNTDVYERVDT